MPLCFWESYQLQVLLFAGKRILVTATLTEFQSFQLVPLYQIWLCLGISVRKVLQNFENCGFSIWCLFLVRLRISMFTFLALEKTAVINTNKTESLIHFWFSFYKVTRILLVSAYRFDLPSPSSWPWFIFRNIRYCPEYHVYLYSGPILYVTEVFCVQTYLLILTHVKNKFS